MAAILEGGPSLQEEEFSYQKKTTRNDELTKIRMPIKFGIGSAMVLLQTRDPKDGQQATRSWGISKEQLSLTALEQPKLPTRWSWLFSLHKNELMPVCCLCHSACGSSRFQQAETLGQTV